jgi:hypothetical protein
MFNLMLTLALAATPGAKPAVNAVCPVQGLKVTEKSKTVVVHGQEYRICCPGDCDVQLAKEPGKYLHEDGTPRNAAKSEKKPASGHRGHTH